MAVAAETTAIEAEGGTVAPGHWRRLDTFLLLALAGICLILIAQQIQWTITPIEDASMLLRYAQNFANGHGIRWNIGQPPVDGATDFLYTVAIGTLARVAHIGVITASRLLNLAAQFSSVLLVFVGGRLLFDSNRWLCGAAAAYLAAGPAVAMANGCFGAPCFAFLLLACWCAGICYARFRPTWAAALCMSLLGLLAGLTRPEGVFIAIMLLVATIYLTLDPTLSSTTHEHPWGQSIRLTVAFTLVFAVLGGAYFVWHWKYFGYPLPNPYYIKGDGHLYPSSVRYSTMNLVRMLAPVFPLIPLGWLGIRTRRLALVLTALLLCFDLMWIMLRNENNHFGRFQYAIVPLVLMTVPALASEARVFFAPFRSNRTAAHGWVIPAAGLLALASSMVYFNRLYSSNDAAWGMRVFATRLQPLAAKGYTMAVTEAGALPLYSQWQTIDGLGLNDSYIAHHHHLSSQYLDRFHPEIIMVHIDARLPWEFSPAGFGRPPNPQPDGGWNQEFMNFYASTHGYTLAAVWGSDQCNLHVYWLRPGFSDYDTVLRDIRDHTYYFLDNGILAHDYRNDLQSTQACAHYAFTM